VVFLHQRAGVVVGQPDLRQSASIALFPLCRRSVVRAGAPRVVGADVAGVAVAASLGGELGVVARPRQRESTATVVGEVVADAGDRVRVVDADRGSVGRAFHVDATSDEARAVEVGPTVVDVEQAQEGRGDVE
jgi:hypothetical protein